MKRKKIRTTIKFWVFLGIFLLVFSLPHAQEKPPKKTFHSSTPFVMAQLKYDGGEWSPRSNAIVPMINFLTSRTSIEAEHKSVSLTADDPEIFSYPFLLWIGNQSFKPLSQKGIENIRRYLKFGGFLLIDNSQGDNQQGFDLSVRKEIVRIFPQNKMKKLDPDHTVWRSFFLLEKATGRVETSKNLEGIQIQGRTVLIYSQNDLLGAWSRDSFGNWEFEVSTGDSLQRRQAYRLGVNIIMYALCDDYKKDSLHVEFILKRRR